MRPHLTLRDRIFPVAACRLDLLANGLLGIDIETVGAEYGGGTWQPRLYHQGLQLPTASIAALSCLTFDPSARGPESPFMYVFGHHDVYASTVELGRLDGNTIDLRWSGLCDIFWDDDYRDAVPFACRCVGTVRTL